jgi:protein gp37
MVERTERSKIAWTDFTFNPWIGCTKVSPACANCYAERENNFRHWNDAGWGKGKPRKRTSVSTWKMPLKWNRQASKDKTTYKVFCASLADVFDDEVPEEWRKDLWELVAKCKNLIFLILTKRPENITKMIPWTKDAPWTNVWLGVTAEDKKRLAERYPILLKAPAVIRFISAEPLLEKVEACEALYAGIDWVIVGGESGSKARSMPMEWARSIHSCCQNSGKAFFMKQLSQADTPDFNKIEAFPKDLQVRQFPM